MEKLTKPQVSLLASYSSPFVLIFALGLNLALLRLGVGGGFIRLLVLSWSFPLGFLVGIFIYFRRSHVVIAYDEKTFKVFKGHREVTSGDWRRYRFVSIIIDSYGRSDVRLYETMDGVHVDLPISRTDVRVQDFRNRIQTLLLQRVSTALSPRVVEVA